MKQTAVEWLFEQVKSKEWQDMFIWHKEETFKKAKEMEKKQIEDAYQDGWMSCEKWFEDEKLDKETYGKQ